MDVALIIETIASVIKTAVDLTPKVITAVEDAKPFAEAIYEALKGQPITQSKMKELEEKIAALSAELQAPLPPETDDDV